MAAYKLEVDIANRGLQHLRVRRIRAFTDASLSAQEMGFAYTRVREAELKEHLWRFATKRVVLRPIDTRLVTLTTSAATTSGTTLTYTDTTGVADGMLIAGSANVPTYATVVSHTSTTIVISNAVTGTVALGTVLYFGPLTFVWTPPAYVAATTYAVGSVVVGAEGDWWQSKIVSNTGNTPAAGPKWAHYAGVETVTAWISTVLYYAGELVVASDGNVYMNLINEATDDDSHDPTTTTGYWLRVNGTVVPISLLYPIGAGPSSNTQTSNVFRLPHGFLRRAPTSPHAAASTYLGTGRGGAREDWVFESNYLISATAGPLMMRYVADFVDVPDMDATFCEMLSARLAQEVGPLVVLDQQLLPILLSNAKAHYDRERKDATAVNAIEIGAIDLELDDYLSCRF